MAAFRATSRAIVAMTSRAIANTCVDGEVGPDQGDTEVESEGNHKHMCGW